MKIQGTSSKSPIGRRKEFDLTNKASVDFTRTSDTMAYANTTRQTDYEEINPGEAANKFYDKHII